MKQWIERGLIFAAGVAVGCATSYGFLQKKFEAVLEDEVRDVREHYQARLADILEKKSALVALNVAASSDTSLSENEYTETLKDGTDYTRYANGEKPDTVNGTSKEAVVDIKNELERVSQAVHDDDFDRHMAERESPEETDSDIFDLEEEESRQRQEELEKAKNDGVRPYAITRGEYMNQKEWYEKLSWNLYQDEVVTDERDDVVLAAEDKVGDELFEAFGVNPSDPDVAYIRNDALGIDFEVCKIAEEYYTAPGKHEKKNPGEATIKLSSER